MASNASATPPPQINLSQEALQGLASTVYELLKDSIGKTMQDLVQQLQQQQQQQQQLQHLQQEQFLQGAAHQIEQQGQQHQEQQQQQFLHAAAQQLQLQGQQQQQQPPARRSPKLPAFNVTDIDLWIGAAEVELDNCRITDLPSRKSEMLKEISKQGPHMETLRGFYTHHDAAAGDPEWGYQALINQLRALFKEKDRQRAARILRPHNLGGRTPCRCWRRSGTSVE